MAHPSSTDSPLHDVASSGQDFASSLYGALSAGNETVLFSPVSLQLVMLMVYIGARGKTAKEIFTGLRIPHQKENDERFFEDVERFVTHLEAKENILNLATGMFIAEGYNVLEEFKTKTKRYLHSTSQLLDFARKNEIATNTLNDWVSKTTNGKIKDLFSPGSIDPSTVMILANAIYFKDSWQFKFNKELTYTTHFTSSLGNKKDVQMMKNKEKYMYADIDNCQVIELPYQDPDFSMLVVLPNEKMDNKEFEGKLMTLNIDLVMSKLRMENVILHLPKFKIQSTLDLKPALQKLGMKTMFESADFSGINSSGGLKISKVKQKAIVEVSEEGVEAAAATVVEMVSYSLLIEPTVKFVVDHQFAFYIIHKYIGNHPLFVGHVRELEHTE